MDVPRFDTAVRALLGHERCHAGAPLAPLTTFRVGGPADLLIDIRRVDELSSVLALASECGVPVTLLGGGSNVVISDSGLRGAVLQLHLADISQVSPHRVRAGAGATINGLVRWTIGRGLAGVEGWAGTPGTVGGAIYGNAHWKGRNIADVIGDVLLVDRLGTQAVVPASDMGFAYDTSRLQHTREIVVWAEFRVSCGDPAALREQARASLDFRKRTQPLAQASAGCVFQNPDPLHDRVPAGIPPSAGALVDRAGLKGFRVGGASISAVHGNFVVNDGHATATDIRRVVEVARTSVLDQFGVTLRDEVVWLGTF